MTASDTPQDTVERHAEDSNLRFDFDLLGHPLNSYYTLDTFVVGECNQFARQAAQAVVENPGRAYNPLFIHGGVGLGKTHLLQAIGRAIKDKWQEMRVAYVCSESFTNQLISDPRHERLDSFHNYSGCLDVLLMDNICFVAGKKQAEGELFRVINRLHNENKQVVLACGCPPIHISGLDEQLRECFCWGLIADLQPPELETRREILAKSCRFHGVELPDDVSEFIAQKFQSSVRDLEGALVRVHAYASLTGTPITLSMAQSVLKSLIDLVEPHTSIEEIQRAVCREFGLDLPQLKSKNVSRRFSYPRQIAMYLARKLTTASLPQIGREFGGKHQTTVLHSINKIAELRETDRELNRLLTKLRDSLTVDRR